MKASVNIVICAAVFLAAAAQDVFAQAPSLDPNPTTRVVSGAKADALYKGVRRVIVRRVINPATGVQEPVFRNVIRISATGINPEGLSQTGPKTRQSS